MCYTPLIAHRTQITKKRVLVCFCFATFAILLMVVMSLVYKNLYFTFASANICITLMIIAFAYTRIFLTARRKFRLENRPGHGLVERNSSDIRRTHEFAREIKLAKSCFLVVVAFLFCFLPVSIISVLSINVSREMVPKFRVLQSWSITIALFNHSLNSIIFFWTRPMLRREAKKVLKDMCAKTDFQ